MKLPKPGKVKGSLKTRSGAPKTAKAPMVIMINVGHPGPVPGGPPQGPVGPKGPRRGPGPMPVRPPNPTAGLAPLRPSVPLKRPGFNQSGTMPVKVGPRLSGNPGAHFIGRRPK